MVLYPAYYKLINIFLWIILLLLTGRQITSIYNGGRFYFIGGLLVVVNSTFGFYVADFIHYNELYNELVISQFSEIIEPFYFWLAKKLPNSYLIWRLVIWGASTYFLIKIFKRLNCNSQFAFLIFTLLLMTYFPAPRQTLGFVVLYYGISLLFFSHNRYVGFLFGAFWIFLSYFLHKSMFIYILLMGLALIPLNKKLIYLSLLAFPFLYKLITSLSSFILLNFANESAHNKGMGYLESDFRVELSIWGMVQIIVTRLPIFLLLFYSIKNIYYKNEVVQYGLKVFLQCAYWLIYVSYLFSGQTVSAFLSGRFWDAAMYPLTFFYAVYLYKQPRTLFIKTCFYMLVISNIYIYSYLLFKMF